MKASQECLLSWRSLRAKPMAFAEGMHGIPLSLFGTGLSRTGAPSYKPASTYRADLQGMPDQRLMRLCESISKETDSARMTALLDELIQLLGEEQDAIRAKINANLKKSSLL
jgi:hypothetical protein